MTLTFDGSEHLRPEDLARIIELVTSRLGATWRPGTPTSQVNGGYYYDILDNSGAVRYEYGAAPWLPGCAWRLEARVVEENIPVQADRLSKLPRMIDEEIMRAGMQAAGAAKHGVEAGGDGEGAPVASYPAQQGNASPARDMTQLTDLERACLAWVSRDGLVGNMSEFLGEWYDESQGKGFYTTDKLRRALEKAGKKGLIKKGPNRRWEPI